MASFDLIDSASFGYRAVWHERAYLARMAIVPILIKLACTVVIFTLDYQDNYLRQGLISLPAAFAQGWLLAQFARTLLLLERWPIYLSAEPNEQQMAALLLRARGIMSSIIMYVIITFLAYGLAQIYSMLLDIVGDTDKAVEAGAEPEASPLFIIPSFALIVASIWMVRLTVLYIPVVVLMPVTEFLAKISGFASSFRLVGVLLVSTLPCFVVAIFISSILAGVAGGADSDSGLFIIIIISTLVKTLISLISTASVIYAFRDILPKHPKALPDISKE